MRFLRRLFGDKQKADPQLSGATSLPSSVDPASDPNVPRDEESDLT